MFRTLVSLIFLCCITPCCWSQQRPNIILINLDDIHEHTLNPNRSSRLFPNMARLHLEGIRFTNAHVVTPLCGPSRCCLLRSQYPHKTGFRVNDSIHKSSNGFSGGYRYYIEQNLHEDDLSRWMQTAGYRTMLVGKTTTLLSICDPAADSSPTAATALSSIPVWRCYGD